MIHVLGYSIDVVKLLVAWAVLSVALGGVYVAFVWVRSDLRSVRGARRRMRRGARVRRASQVHDR